MIHLENVVFSYNKESEGRPALDRLSLEIEEGEYCAVVGPNGSGKSTFARHLNAMLLPDRGEVLVCKMNTVDRRNVWKIRSSVGMVFQNPDNQIVATTVEEDVAFGPENLGIEPKEIRERVEKSLKIVGLEDLKNMDPSRLSGGQKQKLAVAGVISMSPRCIVLDEATAMLDPVGRKELLNLIKRLNTREGITIIHITHNLEEIMEFDRVILMESGRIVYDGSPETLLSKGNLEGMGFQLPPLIRLSRLLERMNVNIPPENVSIESMVGWLCK